jgi:hypothetical protein
MILGIALLGFINFCDLKKFLSKPNLSSVSGALSFPSQKVLLLNSYCPSSLGGSSVEILDT